MRQLSSIELNRIKLLNENSVSVSLIEPTRTGLEKGIMDATGSVRSYLKKNNFHDYELQKQGAKENGVFINARIITEKLSVETKASLYRPKAKGKGGDPRIWIYGLPQYCNANDILALICYDSIIWVINLTQLPIEALLTSNLINPLNELVNEIRGIKNAIAEELLFKLKAIANQGFIKSLVNSDTGVGRTLEKLLGIEMNSSKTPDYKGIELKSFRDSRGTRKGLFAKTPDWELSKFKSRVEILDNFGYWEKGIFRMYNTIRATGRNAQGLMLRVEYEKDWLVENSDKVDIGDFLVWKMEVLKNALSEKHKETFWISTESKIDEGNEFFWYKSVKHTQNPLVDQFDLLIEIGAITLDYPIKRLPDGAVIDKGCNFKIKPKSLDLLFPPSQTYSLLA